MTVTYEMLETFTGERDGESVEDVLVKFSSDDPVWSFTRPVLCRINHDNDVYNETETIESIKRIAEGLEVHLSRGILNFEQY